MRVAFRADGDSIIGTGHLSRCYAIALELMRQNHEVCFFSKSGAIPWLQSRGIPFVKFPAFRNLREEQEFFIRKARLWKADWVILDSYALDEIYYKAINHIFCCAVIDDLARLPYHADILINANLYASSLDYSGVSVKKLLLGGEYSILREEFLNRKPSPFREEVKRLLITMGGADSNQFTPFVLYALSEVQIDEILVIMGAYAQCIDQVREAIKVCKSPVRVQVAPDNIAELFASCDLAISAGGSTVYELCALGLPSILIGQSDNQRLIMDYFQKSKKMLALGEYHNISPRRLLEQTCCLMRNVQKRKDMHIAVQALVSRQGIIHITESISAFPLP